MAKDYLKWHSIKSQINSLDSTGFYFNEKEIWWCYLGQNIGVEQDGKGENFVRPVLIVYKFSRRMCWIIPLSTVISKGSFFFPLLSESNTFRIAILPQMRLIDVKRLINKIDLISELEYFYIKKQLIAFLQ